MFNLAGDLVRILVCSVQTNVLQDHKQSPPIATMVSPALLLGLQATKGNHPSPSQVTRLLELLELQMMQETSRHLSVLHHLMLSEGVRDDTTLPLDLWKTNVGSQTHLTLCAQKLTQRITHTSSSEQRMIRSSGDSHHSLATDSQCWEQWVWHNYVIGRSWYIAPWVYGLPKSAA